MKQILKALTTIGFILLLASISVHAQQRKSTITGTIVDTYCLVTMGMGGTTHQQCAATCAKNGSPLAVKDDKTGTVYLVAGQKHMLYASPGLEKYVEQKVRIRGTIYEKNGLRMILVDSFTPAH